MKKVTRVLSHTPLRRYAGVGVLLFLALPAPLSWAQMVRPTMPDVDVAKITRVVRSAPAFDAKAKTLTYKLSITNTSKDIPIPGPLRLVLKNIAPKTATLAQRDGVTAAKEVYFDFLPGKYLLPDETTPPKPVVFKVPKQMSVRFDVQLIVAGDNKPVSLSVAPAQLTVAVGKQESLRAMGVMRDGSREDVTEQAEWTVKDPKIAKVTSPGVVLGLSQGATVVTAKQGSVVSPPSRVTVTVEPIVVSSPTGNSPPSSNLIPQGVTLLKEGESFVFKTDAVPEKVENAQTIGTLIDAEVGAVRFELSRNKVNNHLQLFAMDSTGKTIGSASAPPTEKELVLFYKVPSGLRRVVARLKR
jgi:hypothetical protein